MRDPATDVAPPENLEGTSFVPLLSAPSQPWKKAAFTTCAIAGYVGRSVRTKRWRYTDWTSQKSAAHEFELYDLDRDPGEQDNLADSMSDMASKLLGKLKSWRAQVGAQEMKKNPSFKPE